MDNIFNIITRIAPYIVFILLEIIASRTLYTHNDFHRAKLINYSNSVSSKLYEKVDKVNTFLSYETTNNELVAENSRLKKELFELNNIVGKEINDSIVAQNRSKLQYSNEYEFSEAKVIHNTLFNSKNYLIINKGKKDGVEIDMGVVTDKGPVGIVIEVSENHSCVMSILNSNASVSAKIKESEIISNLNWSGNDYRLMNMMQVPKHLKIKKGETVTTSGYSSYFPPDLPIGKIHKINPKKSNNYAYIEVALFNDFSKIKNVFVTKNIHQKEIKVLESVIEELKNSDENE